MKRLFIFLITCFMLAFFLIGCENPIISARHPQNFPGSKWMTENEEIALTVEEIYLSLPQLAGTHGYGDDPHIYFFARGEVDIDGEKIDVYFQDYAGSYDIYIISKKEVEEIANTTTEYLSAQRIEASGCVIAIVECDYKSKKHFDAVVTESEYFEIGEKFFFKRVS